MPPQEQIVNEKYHLNQRLTVYILEIQAGLKGDEIIVSRANNGLIEGLFKREVPEVSQGSVVIKGIAREAGNRAKIAVASNQKGIDPVGSCVGQKGVRVQAIIAELGGLEKIDIIQWQENAKDFIAQALSPAKEVEVEVNEEGKVAKVSVPATELSLAIGKEGQNVRLASKLTGYRIEIEGREEVVTEAAKETKEPEETKEAPVEAKPQEEVGVEAKEEVAPEIKVEEPQAEVKETEDKPAEEVSVEKKEETAASEVPSDQPASASQPTDVQEEKVEEKTEEKVEDQNTQ